MFRALRSSLRKLGFTNTESALRWDITRMRARMRTGKMLRRAMQAGPLPARLHFGCGSRKVAGWLNCDIRGTDVDIDLASGRLPFAAGQFEAAAAQHVIEHLELESELRPLLAELHRCLKPGGELWLSCPDMAKVCASYMADRGAGLMADRQTRWPRSTTDGYPDSQVVNYLFHQGGEHKNLFDFDLLAAVLTRAGFGRVTLRQEADLLARFPEFPPRNDDFVTLYVSAVRPG